MAIVHLCCRIPAANREVLPTSAAHQATWKQDALPRPTLSTMHQDICQGTRRIEEMPTPASNEELRAELRARLHEKLRTSDQGGSLRAILQQRDGCQHLPARGMAPYLYVDDRGTASARALLRFWAARSMDAGCWRRPRRRLRCDAVTAAIR